MPKLKSNGLEIEYDTFGEAASRPLLMIMGLGAQMILWEEACGASMGGMIAQALAIGHPARVRSLTSIMSTTGDPTVPPARPEAMQVLLSPPPKDRADNIERAVQVQSVIGGKGFPPDEAHIRERAGRLFDRSFYPAGIARQMSAIVASGSRKQALADVRASTLVIHGTDDPLVPVEGGHATAEAIAGAELMLIEGMGHDLPAAVWPRITQAIAEHTARAERASAA